MKNHEAALKVLVHHQEHFAGAEQYCIDLLKESSRSIHSLNPHFITLLNICLNPDPGYTRHEKFAYYILKKHARSIDPVAALEMLPGELITADIAEFLIQIVQSSQVKVRQSSIFKNMAKIAFLQV